MQVLLSAKHAVSVVGVPAVGAGVLLISKWAFMKWFYDLQNRQVGDDRQTSKFTRDQGDIERRSKRGPGDQFDAVDLDTG